MSLAAMSVNKHGRDHAYRAITLGAASLALLIGIFTAVAWHSHSEWLWVAFPSMFYMKYNTSLAFIAGGVGLIAWLRKQHSWTIAAGGVVLLIGSLTFVQYLTDVNVHFDEFLLTDYRYPENPLHGRMAPGAALALTCFGIVLILLATDRGRRLSLIVTMESLSFVVLAVGVTALAGYLASAGFTFSWGTSAHVAPQAAVGFIALGFGIVALTWQQQSIRIARVPLWVPMLMCFLVLMFDLSTPRGLVAGIGYIPIIFCSLWFTQPYMAFVFAAITTALALLGYLASPPGEFALWIPIANRILTIGALWFVATLVYLRRRTESTLHNYMNELERSNQELDDFAYIASHDLKEPLRGLFNHASFLLEDYQDKIDEDGVNRLNRLRTLCQRMERLINDLMYFSRLGRADFAIQETDPNTVIVEIEQMMETLLSERHARIVVPYALPRIVCDRTRVTEVFRNLVTNAVKYNDKTERLVEIGFLETVNTAEGPEKNVFYVRDNGVGIDPEFHQEIFRIFKRLQNTPDGQEAGTGVGLTFVKKIVERHGGRIWLESGSGTGTAFYFSLNCGRKNQRGNPHARAIDPVPVHSAG